MHLNKGFRACFKHSLLLLARNTKARTQEIEAGTPHRNTTHLSEVVVDTFSYCTSIILMRDTNHIEASQFR